MPEVEMLRLPSRCDCSYYWQYAKNLLIYLTL